MSTTVWISCVVLLASPASSIDPQSLAQRVDAHLQRRIDVEEAVAAPIADDAEFLRRVTLDLIGRIPTAGEVRKFLADRQIDKRERCIDRLLASPDHARHFARVWRALLLPEAEVEPQLRYFEPGLEAWIQQRRAENAGFDAIVRELLTVPIAGADESPQMVLRDLRSPNPLAFIAGKNAEPAKIASASVRVFLGIRLECAQCHDHPFDAWTQAQFWNQAAFFAGIERRGSGPFAPLVEVASRRSIPLMDQDEQVVPTFLDRSEPQTTSARSNRAALADWITAPKNPYFARAIVNRVWAQLFGRGLVDPVDDFRSTNPPSHPELLAELAESFESSGYDVGLLYRALCRTSAYQRTSRQSHASQSRTELFARMPSRAMSGEQFFDSLALAIGYESTASRSPGEPDRDRVRQAVVNLFSGATSADPQTSVAQALALMNGDVIGNATNPRTSVRLKELFVKYPTSPERQVEALYLTTLGRYPTTGEQQILSALHATSDEADRPQRVADIFWMLLNSAEFAWNH